MSIAEAFSGEPLHGRRILIVEDIAILAYGFEDILKGAGAEVVGPALQLKVAERLAGDEKISGTLLDIRLNGDEVWSVAPLLDRKGACLSTSPQGILTGTACRRNGADGGFSFKPARAQAIIDTVAGLFEAPIRSPSVLDRGGAH